MKRSIRKTRFSGVGGKVRPARFLKSDSRPRPGRASGAGFKSVFGTVHRRCRAQNRLPTPGPRDRMRYIQGLRVLFPARGREFPPEGGNSRLQGGPRPGGGSRPPGPRDRMH